MGRWWRRGKCTRIKAQYQLQNKISINFDMSKFGVDRYWYRLLSCRQILICPKDLSTDIDMSYRVVGRYWYRQALIDIDIYQTYRHAINLLSSTRELISPDDAWLPCDDGSGYFRRGMIDAWWERPSKSICRIAFMPPASPHCIRPFLYRYHRSISITWMVKSCRQILICAYELSTDIDNDAKVVDRYWYSDMS